jgi:hypothetical protein
MSMILHFAELLALERDALRSKGAQQSCEQRRQVCEDLLRQGLQRSFSLHPASERSSLLRRMFLSAIGGFNAQMAGTLNSTSGGPVILLWDGATK